MSTPVPASSGAQGIANSGNANNNMNVTGTQFLQLLVAQLKYQNPLQPMDSGQFLSQLATLEQVQLLQGIQSDLDQLVKAQGGTPSGQTQPSGGAGG